MSNEEQKNITDPGFDLGFTPEAFDGLAADQGVGYRRTNIGHYTFEVAKGEIQASKGEKPHNMLRLTWRAVKAHDEVNTSEVGSEIVAYYAGSMQSPPYMQKRLKAVCLALGVAPTKAGLKLSAFIGKRCDASVVWELSKSNKIDELTGKAKWYVNDRIKGERKIGAELPPGLNIAAESLKAVKFLENGDAPEGESAETPEWEAAGGTEGAGGTAGAPSFIAEDQVDALGHTYRAAFKIASGTEAEQHRDALVAAGIDPEGPIKLDLIQDDEIKKAYVAKFGGKPAGGLPPLGGKPAGNARTGQRRPSAGA
jgi:hypothetical protein